MPKICSRPNLQGWNTYVYHDPERDCPMYVGKGKNNRPYIHLVYGATNIRFSNRLKALAKLGLEPLIEVFSMETEDDALLCEIALISCFGRKDLGQGPLYNMTWGGDGVSGYVHTDEVRAKMSIKQQARTDRYGIDYGNAFLWKIQQPDGSIIHVKGLRTWAATQPNLIISMLYRSAKLGVKYKGYQVWRDV